MPVPSRLQANKAALKAAWAPAAPRRRTARLREYYSLGLEANVRVLSRLCDDLLDVPPVRAEIDKWVDVDGFFWDSLASRFGSLSCDDNGVRRLRWPSHWDLRLCSLQQCG